jgi:limonene-1,2-epoxide hydrolase
MENPIEVVRRFCAAWSDNVGAAELAAFFTDDAVYHNIPLAPVTGREAIANTIASFIRPGAPGIESIEFRVINIAANGPVVMTERVDVFRLPGRSFELQVMGPSRSVAARSTPGATISTRTSSPAGWDKAGHRSRGVKLPPRARDPREGGCRRVRRGAAGSRRKTAISRPSVTG